MPAPPLLVFAPPALALVVPVAPPAPVVTPSVALVADMLLVLVLPAVAEATLLLAVTEADVLLAEAVPLLAVAEADVLLATVPPLVVAVVLVIPVTMVPPTVPALAPSPGSAPESSTDEQPPEPATARAIGSAATTECPNVARTRPVMI